MSQGIPPSAPVDSPLRYIGSKKRLAERIIGLMPPHHCYVEPFGGSAAVLLRKPKSAVEVYNDYDSALVNFMEVCRDRPRELMGWLAVTPYSREIFERWRAEPLAGVEDRLERAARYFYLNRVSFGAKIVGADSSTSFGFGVTHSPAEELRSALKRMIPFAMRFSLVQIENRPWHKVIETYDRPDTLFYCDPPYWGAEHFYAAKMTDGGGQESQDAEALQRMHHDLAERLSAIQGNAMVSYYAGPEVDALYGKRGLGWQRFDVKIKKTIGKLNQGDKEGGTAHYGEAHEVIYVKSMPSQQALFWGEHMGEEIPALAAAPTDREDGEALSVTVGAGDVPILPDVPPAPLHYAAPDPVAARDLGRELVEAA